MKIIIPFLVHQKIMHFVNNCDFEVSGLGKVQKTDQGFEVLSVHLLEQKGGGAHTELDPAAVGKLLYQTKDEPGGLNFWWHSHVNMAAFWSSQDRTTIDEIGAQGYCVAAVFNKKGEVKGAFSGLYTDPFGAQTVVTYDNIDVECEPYQLPGNLRESWQSELAEKVKRETYQPAIYGRWQDWSDRKSEAQWRQDYAEPLIGDSYADLVMREEAQLLGWPVKKVRKMYQRNNAQELRVMGDLIAEARAKRLENGGFNG